jgi:hypothetical protein
MQTIPRNAARKSETNPPPRGIRISDALLLAVAVAFEPLRIMASNRLAIVHPERIIVLVGLCWLIAVAVATGLVRGGVRQTTATFATFVAGVMLMTGGGIPTHLGRPLGWVVLVGLVAATTVLMARIESHRGLRTIFIAIAVFLASGPLIAVFEAVGQGGGDISVQGATASVTLEEKPDVFLVVLDGYAGRQTLESDFEVQTPGIVSALENIGFEVPVSAWSSYPTTISSVPSLLNMSYPLQAGDGPSPAAESRLSEVVGGSNSLTTILRAHGYETHMVESGWSGSSCGPEVDRCVSSPLLDELMFAALERSVAGPWILQNLGYSFTVGSQNTMEWLLAHGPALSANDTPEFVFAHVMAPHAPFLLDEECDVSFSDDRSGVAFVRPGDDPDARRRAYLEQARCLDRFMIELGSVLDPEDILVMAGDHGTDRRNQLNRDPSTWETADIIERYNIFLAVRGPEGCSVGDPVILPNVFRRLLGCVATDEVSDVEPRMFTYAPFGAGGHPSAVHEMAQADVESLMHLPSHH